MNDIGVNFPTMGAKKSRLTLDRRSETTEAQLSRQHLTTNWSSGSRFCLGQHGYSAPAFWRLFVGPIQNILSEKNMAKTSLQSWLLFCLTCGLRYSKGNLT